MISKHCVNLFHAQFRYDLQPLLFNTLIEADNGTPTIVHATTPSTAVYIDTTVSTDTDLVNTQHAVFQTKAYMPYQADSRMFIVCSRLDLRNAFVHFKEHYNTEWLNQKHSFQIPKKFEKHFSTTKILHKGNYNFKLHLCPKIAWHYTSSKTRIKNAF